MLRRQAVGAALVALLSLTGGAFAQPAPPPAPDASGQPTPPTPAAPPAETPPAAAGPAARDKAGALDGPSIEAATLQPGDLADQSPAFLVRLQTLLDRAHNSPGAIDGRPGKNLTAALSAYEQSHGLSGGLTPQVVDALGKGGPGPITTSYVITDKDEAGPFIGHLPSDFYAQSKLGPMGYLSPEQELSERFHMSVKLIEALNPGVDFSKAGTTLTVLRPHEGGLGVKVARIEVDKTADQVRAFDGKGTLVASFPSTIGSTEHPAPSGQWAVAYVRFDPRYVYDPRVLTWGPRSRGRFSIAAGPNNPTGVVWIGLSKPTYGIHGSPNPELIGKSASHGCVRLTNWDAWDLGNAVVHGAPVVFVGGADTTT